MTLGRSAMVLMIGAVVWWPASASACSCVPMPSPQEAFTESDAVFRGRVIKIEPKADAAAWEQSSWYRQVQLRLTTSWKGTNQRLITITTEQAGSACGYRFEVGREYIIYAHRSRPEGRDTQAESSPDALYPTEFFTTSCTRTAPVQGAKEDLGHLKSKPKVVLAPTAKR